VPRFSVICVWNDEALLQDYLLGSLRLQTLDHEVILLANNIGRYSSAAGALNEGAARAIGEYLIFSHQDVRLPSADWLEALAQTLSPLDKFGAVGVAGTMLAGRRRRVMSRIQHGIPPKPVSNLRPEGSAPAQTLDECLIVVPRDLFLSYPFDQKVCNGWHLYAVDYCLTIESAGFPVYVVPMEVFHRSTGHLDQSYLETMDKIMAKHRAKHRIIRTTFGVWNTHLPVGIEWWRIRQANKIEGFLDECGFRENPLSDLFLNLLSIL